MAFTVTSNSRLRFSEDLIHQKTVEFWDLPDWPTIPERPDDIFYQVQRRDRIDTLANDFYGDPALWWVIAVANDLELLPADLKFASTIRIPSPGFVIRELFQKALF